MEAPSAPRRRRTGAILLAASIVAAGAVALAIRIRANDPAVVDRATTSESAWQLVMGGLTESGETTVTMARQAFSLTFEPLPDVDIPAGSRDDIQSGTAALRMMIAHWDELAPVEQTTVLSYLPVDDPTATASGDSVVPATEGAAGDAAPHAVQMIGFASPNGAPASSSRRPDADAAGPDEATKRVIESRVAALRKLLDARAGGVLHGTVDLAYNTREVVAGSAAYTLPHSVGQLVIHPTPTTATLSGTSGSYSGCFVALNPEGWGLRGTDLDFVLAHELYHCFEAMFTGDLDVHYDPATAPSWVIEGGANWAAAQVVPTSHYPSAMWQTYLLEPSTPLFELSYAAVGFWNRLGEVSALSTWGALRNALGKSSPDALSQTDGDTDGFLDSWASSLFRQPQYGASWQTNGPTMSGLRFTPEEVTINAGSRVSRTASPHAKTLIAASINTDIVVIVSVGHVTLHNSAHDAARFGQLVYCAREEGCQCPPGSANTAPTPDALGDRRVAFGITGSDRASAVALGGISLGEWCTKADPPISKRPSTTATNGTNTTGGDGSLCQQIVERLGVEGLLNNPTMSPADIQACITEILSGAGFPPRN